MGFSIKSRNGKMSLICVLHLLRNDLLTVWQTCDYLSVSKEAFGNIYIYLKTKRHRPYAYSMICTV